MSTVPRGPCKCRSHMTELTAIQRGVRAPWVHTQVLTSLSVTCGQSFIQGFVKSLSVLSTALTYQAGTLLLACLKRTVVGLSWKLWLLILRHRCLSVFFTRYITQSLGVAHCLNDDLLQVLWWMWLRRRCSGLSPIFKRFLALISQIKSLIVDKTFLV